MIPLATTTITVTRIEGQPSGQDPYDPYDPNPPAPTPIAQGVRAAIGTPAANAVLSGGDRVVYTAQIVTDLADLQPEDTVVDSAGTTWRVLWARAAPGVGLAHTVGEVRLVVGAT